MKKFFLPAIASAVFFIFSVSASAQMETTHTNPSFVSEKGYWVVESNKKKGKAATVYYYTNEHLLLCKEEIKNQKLKLNKPGTKMRLKQSLELAIASYENGSSAVRETTFSRNRPK